MSVDSVFVHKMWNDYELSKMIGEDIPFAMLSDPGGSIGRMYGVYDEDSGVETRGRFIIDPDGNVRDSRFSRLLWAETLAKPSGRSELSSTYAPQKALKPCLRAGNLVRRLSSPTLT